MRKDDADVINNYVTEGENGPTIDLPCYFQRITGYLNPVFSSKKKGYMQERVYREPEQE